MRGKYRQIDRQNWSKDDGQVQNVTKAERLGCLAMGMGKKEMY